MADTGSSPPPIPGPSPTNCVGEGSGSVAVHPSSRAPSGLARLAHLPQKPLGEVGCALGPCTNGWNPAVHGGPLPRPLPSQTARGEGRNCNGIALRDLLSGAGACDRATNCPCHPSPEVGGGVARRCEERAKGRAGERASRAAGRGGKPSRAGTSTEPQLAGEGRGTIQVRMPAGARRGRPPCNPSPPARGLCGEGPGEGPSVCPRAAAVY